MRGPWPPNIRSVSLPPPPVRVHRSGLKRLLETIQTSPLESWEVQLVMVDGQPFVDLHTILQVRRSRGAGGASTRCSNEHGPTPWQRAGS